MMNCGVFPVPVLAAATVTFTIAPPQFKGKEYRAMVLERLGSSLHAAISSFPGQKVHCCPSSSSLRQLHHR